MLNTVKFFFIVNKSMQNRFFMINKLLQKAVTEQLIVSVCVLGTQTMM